MLLGNGAGGLGAKTDFGVQAGPSALAVADLNGDGRPDVVTACFTAGSVSVYLGTGSGGLVSRVDLPTLGGPNGVTAADLNGDGRRDLAVACLNGNGVSVFLGNGAGGFGPRADLVMSTGPYAVSANDVNADGRPDLVVVGETGNVVSIVPALTPTHAALVSSPTLPVPNASFTLTANVGVSGPGSGTPSGNVSFFNGATLLGTSPLSSGVATLSIVNPQLVGHVLTAAYGGDSRFQAALANGVAMSTSFAPHVAAIGDVPNDQGGVVSIRWDASPLDRAPSDPISQYWIWRQVPASFAQRHLAGGAQLYAQGSSTPPSAGTLRVTSDATTTYYWEFLESQISHGFPGYSILAATASDSVAGSNPGTYFMVEAEEPSDGLYWSSAAAVGYSVDNLAPPIPAPFTGEYFAGTADLHWGTSAAPDFATFRLFRGDTPDFVPSAGNQVVSQPDTGFADHAGAPAFYKLAAEDVHGNLSGYALLLPNGTTGVGELPLAELSLAGARPNPVIGHSLRVAFSLARREPATIELLDMRGRRVTMVRLGDLGPGPHVLDLGAGRKFGAGVYLLRLTEGSQARSAKVALLE